jgi:putative adhesin
VAGPPAVAGQARPAPSGTATSRRPQLPWTSLVVACAATLIAAGVGLGIWWAVTKETRIASYRVTGSLTRVQIDASSGDVEVIDAPGSAVQVRRTDSFAFDRPAHERRSVSRGVLRLSSRCPRMAVGRCSSSYRVAVPENVPVEIHTGDGAVRLSALRGSAEIQTGSGDVTVDGFCGFALSVKTGAGDARATATCSPQSLSLRSSSGNLEATVPTGSYRIEADSNAGRSEVAGLQPAAAAPYEVQALSDSGDVTVRGGS